MLSGSEHSLDFRTTGKGQSRFLYFQLFATPWTVAHQASLSMGFPRQESKIFLDIIMSRQYLNVFNLLKKIVFSTAVISILSPSVGLELIGSKLCESFLFE